MNTTSSTSLLEEHLDLTLRLLLGFSATMSLEDLRSLHQRLAQMHHAVGHVLTLRTLESEGVAPLGKMLSPPLVTLETHFSPFDRVP
jgi:hypothetical protein